MAPADDFISRAEERISRSLDGDGPIIFAIVIMILVVCLFLGAIAGAVQLP